MQQVSARRPQAGAGCAVGIFWGILHGSRRKIGWTGRRTAELRRGREQDEQRNRTPRRCGTAGTARGLRERSADWDGLAADLTRNSLFRDSRPVRVPLDSRAPADASRAGGGPPLELSCSPVAGPHGAARGLPHDDRFTLRAPHPPTRPSPLPATRLSPRRR
jgi:hypothetical protein